MRGPTLLVPLGLPAFRRLWVGASLSTLADQAFLISLTWLVLQITDSGVSLGIVLAVASIPGIILTPVGGVLSDRLPPAYIMSSANLARAALMAVLALLVLTDTIRVWHVYLLAGGLSALDAVYYPASMSAVPALVDRERLNAANALSQGVEQISGILGPALSGLALALFGLWVNLGVNAVLFLISALILFSITRAVSVRSRVPDRTDETDVGREEEKTDALSALTAGVRHAWADPVSRTIMLILVGINLAMAGPIYVGGSLLAEARLGGSGAFGTLVAVAGVGALIGAIVAGSVERVRRRGLVELASTAAIGVGVGGLAFAPNLPVASLLAAFIGMAASFLGVINISWLQERSDPNLIGRVMSLAMLSTVALDPVSYLLAGLLVEINLTAVFLFAGGLLLLTALIGAMSQTMRTAD